MIDPVLAARQQYYLVGDITCPYVEDSKFYTIFWQEISRLEWQESNHV